MIQARLTDGSFLFCFDAENVRRLKDHKPLHIDLTRLGGTDKLVIVYGDTQKDILDALEQLQGGPLPPAQPTPPDTTKQ